jgi:WD40 repeat protein
LTFLEKLQLEGIAQITIQTACNMSQLTAVLETQFSGQSDNPAPPSDKKGKKRAIAGSDVESTPPWKRTHPGPIQESLNSTRIKEPNVENTPLLRRAHPWPIQESMYSTQVKSDGDAGVKEIVFSSDGERMAIACSFLPFLFLLLLRANISNVGCDQTIRIWSVPNRIETARLAQAISSIAWMANDNAVITLGQDGIIGTWTQQASVTFDCEFGLS